MPNSASTSPITPESSSSSAIVIAVEDLGTVLFAELLLPELLLLLFLEFESLLEAPLFGLGTCVAPQLLLLGPCELLGVD